MKKIKKVKYFVGYVYGNRIWVEDETETGAIESWKSLCLFNNTPPIPIRGFWKRLKYLLFNN